MKRYDYEWTPWGKVYLVLDRKRGQDLYEARGKAMAECHNPDDAQTIADALNQVGDASPGENGVTHG